MNAELNDNNPDVSSTSFQTSGVINRRILLRYSLLGIAAGSLGIGRLDAIVRSAGDSGDKPYWGYTGDAGPDRWGELSDAYATCTTGSEQSPIDLTKAIHGEQPSLSLDYQPTPLKIKNNGRTIQIDYAPGSTIRLDGERFELKQFHFHAPSEHLENGIPAAMEVHFVHQNAETQAFVVIGVLLREGTMNTALQQIWNYMPDSAGVQTTVQNCSFNAMSLFPTNTEQFYRYHGSLTTPPCSETVNWIVMKETITVSLLQVDRFIQAIGKRNARPVQPLNRRFLLD
ncbi:carbonic anhydrase [Leptolyngbya sp. Heron Island J]|uniref:carbonic anhydrase n=1 Tax=Leptolyngbya sp. Heron Island J TaxID=1385935 RepID=UPI0003B9CAFC|nr:carbonic anhydrase family protein [Leptolyngbya sp. Heron Island J]ESA33000.1 carbonic anhydrase [Leptolyngbya sp. Heron Island J]